MPNYILINYTKTTIMKFTASLLIAAVSGLQVDTSIIYRSDKTEADYRVSDADKANWPFFFPYPLQDGEE